MVGCESSWEAVAFFCEEVILQKEADPGGRLQESTTGGRASHYLDAILTKVRGRQSEETNDLIAEPM